MNSDHKQDITSGPLSLPFYCTRGTLQDTSGHFRVRLISEETPSRCRYVKRLDWERAVLDYQLLSPVYYMWHLFCQLIKSQLKHEKCTRKLHDVLFPQKSKTPLFVMLKQISVFDLPPEGLMLYYLTWLYRDNKGILSHFVGYRGGHRQTLELNQSMRVTCRSDVVEIQTREPIKTSE